MQLKPAPISLRRGLGRTRARGFTLIELLVAFVLLGILVTLGLPSFTAWIHNSQIRSVAEALQNGVRLAQNEAVRRNRQVVFSLTNAQPGLNVAAEANGSNWSMQTVPLIVDEESDFIQGGALASVASGVAIAAGSSALCFNSNGRLAANASPAPDVPGSNKPVCTAGAMAFDVSRPGADADRPLRVTVAVGGQVRMCDPNRPTLSSTSPDGCP